MNKKIIYLIIFTNILLLAGQYLVSSVRSADGERLSYLNRIQIELTQKNNLLKSEIYKHTSLDQIELKSKDLNLTSIKVKFVAPLSVASAVAGQ